MVGFREGSGDRVECRATSSREAASTTEDEAEPLSLLLEGGEYAGESRVLHQTDWRTRTVGAAHSDSPSPLFLQVDSGDLQGEDSERRAQLIIDEGG